MAADDSNKAGEARKKRYLQAALRCFKRLGLNATTMDDIATEAGVKRITLYRQFGSRTNLVRLIVRGRFEAFNRRIGSRISLSRDLATVLEEYLIISMDETLKDPLTRDTIHGKLDFTSPGEALHAASRTFWEPLITAAQRKGKLDPRMDIDAAAQWILVCQFTLCRLELDSPLNIEHARQLIRRFILPAFVVSALK